MLVTDISAKIDILICSYTFPVRTCHVIYRRCLVTEAVVQKLLTILTLFVIPKHSLSTTKEYFYFEIPINRNNLPLD